MDKPNPRDYIYEVREEEEKKIKLLIYAGKEMKGTADIEERHSVDLTYWKRSKLKTRTWEVDAKVKFPSGEDKMGRPIYTTRVLQYPLHYIAVEYVPRFGNMQVKMDELKAHMDEYNAALMDELVRKQTPTTFTDRKVLGDCWYEIMLCDLHYGKVAYDNKRKEYSWGNEEVTAAAHTTVDYLLSRVDTDLLKGIIFPVGNDVVHIDNLKNTTTANTGMDVSQLWFHLVLEATNMYIAVIDNLAHRFNEVIVPVTMGNHDYHTCFSIGLALQQYFHAYANVTIMIEPVGFPLVEKGKFMIGYMHGDEVNAARIHTMLSIDYAEAFGRTKYRAVHVGHFHINLSKQLQTKNVKMEEGGVEVEYCPSITPTDRWHGKHLFRSLRRSKSFLWSEQRGKLAEHYYNYPKVN